MSNLAEEIEAASNRWMQAWVQRDPAVLEEMLAPDYALIVSATPTRQLDRSAWLATACTRYLASEFRYRDVVVRELGSDIAVMSSIAEFKATIDGAPRQGPLFIVDVWRRNGDQWQVCSRYSSAPEEALQSATAVTALK